MVSLEILYLAGGREKPTMKNMKKTSSEGIHAIVLVEYPLNSVVS